MSSATPVEPAAPQGPFIAAKPEPAVEAVGVPSRAYGTAPATGVWTPGVMYFFLGVLMFAVTASYSFLTL